MQALPAGGNEHRAPRRSRQNSRWGGFQALETQIAVARFAPRDSSLAARPTGRFGTLGGELRTQVDSLFM